MRNIFATLLILAVGITSQAQQAVYLDLEGNKINLSKEIVTQKYTDENTFIEMYLPHKPSGAAIMIYPGGGYIWKAIDNEGRGFVNFFNEQGIAVFIVSYALPFKNDKLPLQSVEQAMRTVQQHAEEWNIDPTRIGIMGSSAGGHLASTHATHFSSDTRPAFQILLYPVISLDPTITHGGTRKNLIGEDEKNPLITYYSNNLQIKENTPPAFIAVTQDDSLVPVEHSLLYFQALTEKNVPAELHIFPTGGHGFGSNKKFKYNQTFLTSLKQFLDTYAVSR